MADTNAFGVMAEAIDYPMYVVTTTSSGERSGCLVGFASQVSIDPPQFLVAISQANHTHRIAVDAEYLAIHLIATDHVELAALFGGRTGDETDKFQRCRWHDGPRGLPILDDAAIWFAGRIADRVSAGDHTLHIVEPDGGEIAVDEPERNSWVSYTDTRGIEPGHGS